VFQCTHWQARAALENFLTDRRVRRWPDDLAGAGALAGIGVLKSTVRWKASDASRGIADNALCPLHGGRCVGIPGNPPEFPSIWELSGTPTRTVRHLASAGGLPSARSFTMSTRALFPQLHALIGDADVAERVEVLLDDPRDLLPALLARMDGRDAADGQRLDVQGASPAQAATMAGLSRTLAGLNTLIQLLHAAEIAREQGGARQQLE